MLKFSLQIYGPGGQDLMTDNDGPILVYRKRPSGAPLPAENHLTYFPLDYYTSAGSYVCYPHSAEVKLCSDVAVIHSSVSTGWTSLLVGLSWFDVFLPMLPLDLVISECTNGGGCDIYQLITFLHLYGAIQATDSR